MATPTTLPATFVAGNVLTAAQMNDLRGAFRILQVVQTAKDDTFSTTSTTYVDVTGLSATITPTFSTSKVLVVVQVQHGHSSASEITNYTLTDSANTILIPAASPGSRTPAFNPAPVSLGSSTTAMYVLLHSPATTSAYTYKIRVKTGGGTAYVNRSATDTDSAAFLRSTSSVTLFEVSA